ncbi:MAG: ABC transporter substrate-binding protein [Bdellovibrionales bacterium]|jgi:branched-chain amino acid transport system substrate-binding protein|nr:ABC transporter substrate-binding protein [Bdellovibrionales bacterium]MBT3525133.1 ABC transporter substrate-binding protein [Bdellovibrionales bacterium]MBT7668864.1 ABC transporter substrate-binding protein [Bdellovibrionales bacterium]MBT7766134.1 ABC transporter substrate-binding protein [Bdellovibrionales bacterium]
MRYGRLTTLCISLLMMTLTSPLWASKKTITIGAVFPMTGPIATYGQESVNGINLALKKVGDISIKGRKIRLIVEDNKGEPIESANSVRKLINIDKVNAVIGSVASSNTLAGAPIAQQAEVPLLTPASTNEAVTKTGNFISRTCFTDGFQGVVMARFAFNNLKKRNVAIIIDNSSDYSKGLAAVFKKEFQRLGGKLVSQRDFAYQQKDIDFKSLLRKVKRKRPDVIFLPGYYTEVGLILRQARQMNIKMPFLGGDGWDSPKLQELAGPKGIKNNYISSHFSPDDQDPMVQEFVKKYIKIHKQRPGAMAALGYDGMLVLLDALKRAKSLKSKDLALAINSTKQFKGVTGTISIDRQRNATKSAVVLETTAKGNIFNTKVNP